MPRLTDGHPSIMLVMPQAGVTLFETELTPPGIDGGGPNDTTTMRNTAFRTRQPKRLITLTELTIRVSYDPAFYNVVVANINVNQLMTVQFSDGSEVDFWGWIDKFVPDPIREGEQPTAMVTIQPSNQNTIGTEVAPVYRAP